MNELEKKVNKLEKRIASLEEKEAFYDWTIELQSCLIFNFCEHLDIKPKEAVNIFLNKDENLDYVKEFTLILLTKQNKSNNQ